MIFLPLQRQFLIHVPQSDDETPSSVPNCKQIKLVCINVSCQNLKSLAPPTSKDSCQFLKGKECEAAVYCDGNKAPPQITSAKSALNQSSLQSLSYSDVSHLHYPAGVSTTEHNPVKYMYFLQLMYTHLCEYMCLLGLHYGLEPQLPDYSLLTGVVLPQPPPRLRLGCVSTYTTNQHSVHYSQPQTFSGDVQNNLSIVTKPPTLLGTTAHVKTGVPRAMKLKHHKRKPYAKKKHNPSLTKKGCPYSTKRGAQYMWKEYSRIKTKSHLFFRSSTLSKHLAQKHPPCKPATVFKHNNKQQWPRKGKKKKVRFTSSTLSLAFPNQLYHRVLFDFYRNVKKGRCSYKHLKSFKAKEKTSTLHRCLLHTPVHSLCKQLHTSRKNKQRRQKTEALRWPTALVISWSSHWASVYTHRNELQSSQESNPYSSSSQTVSGRFIRVKESCVEVGSPSAHTTGPGKSTDTWGAHVSKAHKDPEFENVHDRAHDDLGQDSSCYSGDDENSDAEAASGRVRRGLWKKKRKKAKRQREKRTALPPPTACFRNIGNSSSVTGQQEPTLTGVVHVGGNKTHIRPSVSSCGATNSSNCLFAIPTPAQHDQGASLSGYAPMPSPSESPPTTECGKIVSQPEGDDHSVGVRCMLTFPASSSSFLGSCQDSGIGTATISNEATSTVTLSRLPDCIDTHLPAGDRVDTRPNLTVVAHHNDCPGSEHEVAAQARQKVCLQFEEAQMENNPSSSLPLLVTLHKWTRRRLPCAPTLCLGNRVRLPRVPNPSGDGISPPPPHLPLPSPLLNEYSDAKAFVALAEAHPLVGNVTLEHSYCLPIADGHMTLAAPPGHRFPPAVMIIPARVRRRMPLASDAPLQQPCINAVSLNTSMEEYYGDLCMTP